jgi:hypothetical protein
MTARSWQRLCGYCVFAVLIGCQTADPRSGFYSSPLQPGDEVEVLKEIPVPAGQARVYLQHGGLTSYGGTNQYAPFCYFRLREPLPAAQQVNPGVFIVQSVWLDETSVGLERPTRVASAMLGFGEGWSTMAYQFHMTLVSDAQPGVKLVCSGSFDSPAVAVPIRLPEVREALGEYAVVRVPENPPGG